jgi:TonB-linked SusC/RagA family outer membrane protein
VKEESFLKNVNWLSELKLRGSYGKVGNQGSIAPFQYLALYSSGSPAANSGNLGYPFNKVYQSGIAATQPANPLLRWETDYTTNLGVDAGFLNGNLTLTVDWFQRKSQDFLLNLAAPAQSGYNFLTRNVGSMENKGIEVALTYNRNVSQDFRYNVGLTFSAINNKLTSITSGTDAVTNFGGLGLTGQGWGTFTRTEVGQPVGSFYGYQSLGIFQSKAQIDALNAIAVQKFGPGSVYQKTATSAGDRYFADTNGDGRVTPSDQINLGSPIPKFFGGLNFDVSYKAFDLNGFFYGVSGNKILNYQESSLQSFQNRGFVGVENISEEYYNNRWTASNPSNTFSRVTYNDDAIGSNVPSSAWIQNGSFLRLKNVILGYTLPLGLVEKAALSKVRVYFSTQNVFTITKYKGLDPEIGLQGGNATQNGVDNGTYPGSRFYTVGLNVTLK